jgi:polyhydroxybutyrate depolymerase
LLYVPPGLDRAQPAPVVVSLHGFASTAKAQEKVPRWQRIADAENLVMVYPEGASFPQRWNAGDAYLADKVDDVQFFRDLVADLAEAVAIDPARVYVTGISNGGAMASRIACEAADLVAAVGTVAAVPSEAPGGCRPSRPVPIMAFHGTADPLVKYEGGTHDVPWLRKVMNVSMEPMSYPPVETWIADWAQRNGCSTAPEVIPARGDVRGIRYSGCNEGAEVVLYTIDGGGHTWPGGRPVPLVGKTSTDIDASAVLWAFFAAHPLDSSP